MMARFRFVTIALVAFATSASAKELWERTWIEVRSPHFLIVSTVSEKQSVDLAQDLERFRTAVQMVTNIGRFEERIPTRVYVLPYPVEGLGFKGDIKGYFLPGMRANYAAVVPASGAALDDVLKHEYVHFLVHNRDTLSYPNWFDEGFAEVFQTLTARADRIDYGQPSRVRFDWLEGGAWMPFDELLDTRDIFELSDAGKAMFYAQSWLLMHYLMLGRPDRDFAADATAFLLQVESGDAPPDAFEQAFGLRVAKLRDTLIKYISNDVQVVRLLNQNLPAVPIEVAPVATDSIASQLGLLALRWGQVDEARRYWDAALALNPKNTRALVGLGDYHKRAGQLDEAQSYYERAIALEPQNPYPELDYAEYFLERAQATKDATEIDNYLIEARRHFSRSYKIDADNPETLAMNGSSYLREGDAVEKGLESLKAAHAMLPSQAQIKFLLAQAYVMTGDRTKAEPLLRSLVAWDQPETAAAASKLLQQLSGTEVPDGTAAPEDPAARAPASN